MRQYLIKGQNLTLHVQCNKDMSGEKYLLYCITIPDTSQAPLLLNQAPDLSVTQYFAITGPTVVTPTFTFLLSGTFSVL